MRAARCEAGPETSIFSTSCPEAASAPAIALTVSTVSNSASSSASVSLRLWVNAIFIANHCNTPVVARKDSVFRRGAHPGIVGQAVAVKRHPRVAVEQQLGEAPPVRRLLEVDAGMAGRLRGDERRLAGDWPVARRELPPAHEA